MVDKTVAETLVEMRDHVRVALASEHVAVPGEQVADRVVVVQLAVLDRAHTSVFIRRRLVTGGDIDNAEATGAEGNPGCLMNATLVRAPVRHRVGHVQKHVARHDPPRRS